MKQPYIALASTALITAMLSSTLTIPRIAQADNDNNNRIVVYFTRHAEKETQLMALEDGKFMEICGLTKCAEILNAKGELRAELLAEWFEKRGIMQRLTHAFSSHKQRTRQTIEPTVSRAVDVYDRPLPLSADTYTDADGNADFIQQLPDNGLELAPESTSSSEDLTVSALRNLPGGSVALVAGHSGTIYDIFEKLGVNTDDNEELFPKDTRPGKEGKVPTFGDIWKLVLRGDRVRVSYRINLQPQKLTRNW